MINKDTEFKISSNVVTSELNNQSVILNLNTGVYFQANELGTFIISELKNYTDITTLQEKISLSFNVSNEVYKDELKKFIDTLIEKNLLKIK